MYMKHVGYVHIKRIDSIRYNLIYDGNNFFYMSNKQNKVKINLAPIYHEYVKNGKLLTVNLDKDN